MIDERNNELNRQAGFAEKREFIKMCRRALVQRDMYAREWLQCSTQKLLQESLHNHPYYEELQRTGCIGNEGQYVTLTFERFWQMADQQKLWLHTRSQMLRHLRATLNSLILEALRTHRRQELASYSGISPDGHTLWSIIQGMLPDERERRVAYLLYHCGLKPMEIVCTCRQECNDVQEIHRVRRVVIEKIQPYV